LLVRPIQADDVPSVIDLINADRLPGQPVCDTELLHRALRGDFPGDPRGWSGFNDVRTLVAERGGRVVGVASSAVKVTDGSGWLLWLHASEQRPVVEALLDRVLNELGESGGCHAFGVAVAFSLGVEALPVSSRQVTDGVLQERGFGRWKGWRYLAAPLDPQQLGPAPEPLATVAVASGPGEPPAWRLEVGTRRQPVAVAEVSLGDDGCGLLAGIQVDDLYRGRGVERGLLREAMHLLAAQGAQTIAVILDRSRLGPEGLEPYRECGFHDLDELWSYRRSSPSSGAFRLPRSFG
jgi:GNAT superfamily N-acetyltransferase